MGLMQAIRLSVSSIFAHRLRSFLTMLGVIIGVFSVVALISLGQGATKQVTEQVQGMGANLITITITNGGAQGGLTLEEAAALENRPGVKDVVPVVSGRAVAKQGTRSMTALVEGVTPAYHSVRNHTTTAGRPLAGADVSLRQNVAVLGTEIVEELFPGQNPVGAQVQIHGAIFTVVGVLEEKGSGMGGSNDNKILIPVTTAQRLLRNMNIATIYVQAESPEQVGRAKLAVEASLKQRFRADDAFQVIDMADILSTVNQVTGTLTLMLGGIAAISLLVGGIGIMNIMLVSVTERTREIGINKALGAKKQDILLQFLVESVVISGTGGLIGLLLGQVFILLIQRVTGFAAVLSPQVVALSLSFSLGVGMFFGIWPANKAAGLHPIEALRAQ